MRPVSSVLGLPADVVAARPTTDTFSLEQGRDEFYFALPYEKVDLALWAKNSGRPAKELAAALEISTAHLRHAVAIPMIHMYP